MLDLEDLVKRFFLYMEAENIVIYNEFSFQHEIV